MNKEEHLLVCLSEECAEVQQAVSKALRFGLDDCRPRSNISNLEDIAKEVNHVHAVVELLIENLGVPFTEFCKRKEIAEKKDKVKKFMEYAKKRGECY